MQTLPIQPLRLVMTSDFRSLNPITYLPMNVLLLWYVPRRSNLTSYFKSVTLITHVAMSIWPLKAYILKIKWGGNLWSIALWALLQVKITYSVYYTWHLELVILIYIFHIFYFLCRNKFTYIFEFWTSRLGDPFGFLRIMRFFGKFATSLYQRRTEKSRYQGFLAKQKKNNTFLLDLIAFTQLKY